MTSLVDKVANVVGHIIRGWPRNPGLAVSAVTTGGSHVSIPITSNDVDSLFGWSVLNAVPKQKTSTPKKMTRRHAFLRTLHPNPNLVTCQACGAWHEAKTICGKCYAKVREETERIKARLLAYDPYNTDELPVQESVVLYKGETDSADQDTKALWKGKRIIEMDTKRPEWFSPKLKLKSTLQQDDNKGSMD